MRAKRAKQYRKLMQQYSLSFGHRPPYQVLLDAQMIKDSAACKMHLGKLLEGTLHGEIKPMITQCCIRHLYNHPTSSDTEKRDKDAWIEVAKAAERRRCGHHELEQPLSTLECLESVVDPKNSGTNKHRYVVASQDPEVRARMRAVAGVPIVYLKRSVMILEPMAGATEEARDKEEREKIRAGLKGRRGASTDLKRKRQDGEDDVEASRRHGTADGEDAPVPKKKKAKGPKGPNPLSVKKPKKEKSVNPAEKNPKPVLREASKQDPQAVEKALGGGDAGSAGLEGVSDNSRKRKRKRKPKEESTTEALAAGAEED